jgi:ABC-2 type transport system permease protein
MRKYFLIAKNTWDEAFVYRINLIVWRLRNVLQVLTIYFLWFSILPKHSALLGYSQQQMLTYILGTTIVGSIVFSSLIGQVGEEINQGNLSNHLLKPCNYFYYWFARDIGDKAMNTIFTIIELIFLIVILRPPIIVQTNVGYIILAIIAIINGIFIHFFINFLLGFIGFWSSEIWAPRFIFFSLYTFFSGNIFPLDILPKPVFFLFQLLPFSYLLYFPIKLYMGQVQRIEVFSGFFISYLWVLLLAFFVKKVWKKGLRIYTAQGK